MRKVKLGAITDSCKDFIFVFTEGYTMIRDVKVLSITCP